MAAAAGLCSASARRRGLSAFGGSSAFAFATAGVVALSAFSGGYYPQSWGWASLGCLALALGSVLRSRRIGLPTPAWVFLAGLTGFAAWVGASTLRPGAATLAVPELERTVLYVLIVWASLVVSRHAADAAGSLLAGLLAGIVLVCCWGLEIFLLPHHATPDPYEGRLLFQPVGYANAMGILAAVGLVLALAAACHGRSAGARALAAGSLVPLAATLWFTQSVGAAGLAVMVALDPLRRRLVTTVVVAVPLPLLAVWLGSRSRVGDPQAAAGAVVGSGHVVAAALVLVTLASASIAFLLLRPVRLARVEGPAAVLAVVVVAAAISVAGAKGQAAGLGDRAAYWRAALADTRAHPLFGSGAGSFEVAWLQYRTDPVSTLDAHNLYLETLAELGPFGLALLAGALLVPFRALVSRSRRPAVAAAGAAYVAVLVHAALDWDWELPAVVLVGLVCGVALVLESTRERVLPAVTGRSAALAAAATLVCVVPITVELIGNQALASAEHAASSRDWTTAEDRARAASTWQPWSARPRLVLGLAQLAAGEVPAARASFAQAVRVDPNDARAWYELGSVSGPRTRSAALRRLLILDPRGIGAE
jgi:O-Antigen ligase